MEKKIEDRIKDAMETYLSFDQNYMRYELDSDDEKYFINDLIEIFKDVFSDISSEGENAERLLDRIEELRNSI